MSTNTIVTDGELGMLAKKQHELFTRVKKGVLPVSQVLTALQSVIEGKVPVIPTGKSKQDKSLTTHIINLFTDPYIPGGLSKVERHQRGIVNFEWNPTKVRLHLSPNQTGDKTINGKRLSKELTSESPLNANLLDYLLNNQHLIPEGWKKDAAGNGYYIYFWGTIYRTDVNLYVRFLYSSGSKWISSYRCIDDVLSFNSPAVCLTK